MKIGIDIDEVVTEYLKSFLEFAKVKLGRTAKLEDFKDYIFTEPLGLSLDEACKLVKEHTSLSNTLVNLGLVNGAKEAISLLAKNNDIFFITSRHPNDKIQTIEFFELHFPGNKFEIHFSSEAWKDTGNKTKLDICKELEIEVLLEDNKKYALNCASNGVKVILFDKPWNNNLKEDKNIFRVQTWGDALKKIKEIKHAIRKN